MNQEDQREPDGIKKSTSRSLGCQRNPGMIQEWVKQPGSQVCKGRRCFRIILFIHTPAGSRIWELLKPPYYLPGLRIIQMFAHSSAHWLKHLPLQRGLILSTATCLLSLRNYHAVCSPEPRACPNLVTSRHGLTSLSLVYKPCHSILKYDTQVCMY